jgi:hypothetical protein
MIYGSLAARSSNCIASHQERDWMRRGIPSSHELPSNTRTMWRGSISARTIVSPPAKRNSESLVLVLQTKLNSEAPLMLD